MALLDKLNRLNGWQRLYFAILIFIYLPIAGITVSERIYIPTLTDKQFLEKTPTDLLLLMKDKKAFLNNHANKPDWDIFVDSNKFILLEYDFGYSWRYTVAIDNSIGEEKAKAMGTELGRALASDYNQKALIARAKILATFIAVALFIYLFGWALGWVYRGFRKNKE